jgi:hypothetical protein
MLKKLGMSLVLEQFQELKIAWVKVQRRMMSIKNNSHSSLKSNLRILL